MKNLKLTISFLANLIALNSIGQIIEFTQVMPLPPAPLNGLNLVDARHSSVVFVDIDNDSDEDVLITGENDTYSPDSRLYVNDGSGFYTEVVGAPFEDVRYGSVAVADIENDGDQDILITGDNVAGVHVAKLYTNDGIGNFSEVIGSPFDGVYYSSVAFTDIENDNDQDILITGRNNVGQRVAKLYNNDGAGNYTLVPGTPFVGVQNSSIAFADIDLDNDSDLLITGLNSSSQSITELYSNDGSGTFTVIVGTTFEQVKRGSVAFADTDSDNDLDLVITGENNSSIRVAKLYLNDGVGNYSLLAGTPFTGVYYSAVGFADVDNDTDFDLLLTGSASGPIAKLYLNDGMSGYSLAPGVALNYSSSGFIAFSDIENDNDVDILITGDGDGPVTRMYVNDGAANFLLVTGTSLNGVWTSSSAFADIDNDNDQDLLIAGSGDFSSIPCLYKNDGLGNYDIVAGTPFTAVTWGSVNFSDIDGDNDSDVLITGTSTAKLYLNDGLGNFVLMPGTPFIGVSSSGASFADIDNDNDPDVIITGGTSSGSARLYSNDGNGNFTLVVGTTFIPVRYSSVDFADVDNDSDHDVIISGQNDSDLRITKLYKNDGSGNFVLTSGTPFQGVDYSCVKFVDIDNDIDQDVLIMGATDDWPNFNPVTKLYTNNGSGVFSYIAGTPFPAVCQGSIAIGDVDSDNDSDILISGNNPVAIQSKLYSNNGSGSFTLVSGMPFDAVQTGSVAFADINNDNDLDVLITGLSASQKTAKLYSNNTCIASTGVDFQSACSSYTWIDGITYMLDNNIATYNLENAAANGCDSLVTLNLILYNSEGIDSQTACSNFTWIDGNNYTASNNSATFLLNNSFGCDSLVTLDLTINSPSAGVDYISSCVPIIWTDGNTYSVSNNIATHVLINNVGCDSLVTLNFTLNSATNGVDTQLACDNYTWIDDITYSSNNNTSTFTLTNSNGCDSIVTLNLTIRNSNTGTDVQNACGKFNWIDGNEYLSNNNTATFTLVNSVGCDSVVTLNLTITDIDSTVFLSGETIMSNAFGAIYQWLDCSNAYIIIPSENGQSFNATTDGNYAVEISQNGCKDTSDCININSLEIQTGSTLDSILVYPNPNHGEIYIDVNGLENISVKIYTAAGELIHSAENINSEIYQLELNVSPGFYCVEISSKEATLHYKLIMQ